MDHMTDINTINGYISRLLYTVSRPRMAEILSSTATIENIINTDISTRLMCLGALFASGKLDECIQMADRLDFSDIAGDDASLLVLIIFSKYYEHGLVDQPRASALKHILTALCPEALLAHEKYTKPLSPPVLIRLDYSRTIDPSVSGAIFTGEFVFGPNSRKSEIGYRLRKALTSQGWSVGIFSVADVSGYSSSEKSDFALIDVFAFYQMAYDEICHILSRLRRHFNKIILFDADVWAGRFDTMLRAISSHIDYVWGFTAGWCLEDEADFRGRCIVFPNFGGFDHPDNISGVELDWNLCTYNFTGSVQRYNLNRISWVLEFIHHRLPIEITITNPEVDDGLDPADSQQIYSQTLAATHAAVNLTTRPDGSRIITGRALEIVSLNRLLIQESCPVFNRYFVEGEHFLEFSDIDGLRTITEFLRSHPKTAQKVCLQGYQYYKQHYSCNKLVEHFQTLI